jgi:hypothetical protein
VTEWLSARQQRAVKQAEKAAPTEAKPADPVPAAAWLECFLHQSGMTLLHDDRLWRIVDAWLVSLSDDNFARILPLIRRTFAQFPSTERTQLGERARHTGPTANLPAAAAEFEWNETRALKPLAVLEQMLGL